MTDVQGPSFARSRLFRTGLLLWALSLIGEFLVLPYATTLEAKALAVKAAHLHVSLQEVVALSVVQSAVLMAVAVFVGLWAARKLSLGAPVLTALVSGQALPKNASITVLLAIVIGVATGFAILLLDNKAFASIPSVAYFIAVTKSTGVIPHPWQGFLASFYGALDEEVLVRLGLLSVVALLFRAVARRAGMRPDEVLPSGVFWVANIVVAILFGIGHLPAAAALGPLTIALVVRIIALNALGGVVFGALYRRYGLEWGMAAHFGTDIVLHVMA